MLAYKWDPHVHTSEVSPCGRLSGRRLVDLYQAAGYAGLVVTDHYTPDNPALTGRENRVARFLAGYRQAKERGRAIGLTVLLGMELRFAGEGNDYLVYGVDEDFLLAYPDLCQLGLPRFHALAAARGLLVYQAHPFRTGCTPGDPRYLDGVEIMNGNPRHESRNELAAEFADAHGLRMLSGSDCHQEEDIGRGGFTVREKIVDMADLVRVLRAGGPRSLLGLPRAAGG